MAERKRNKEIHFYVTEEEHKLIRRKMIESKTKTWELIFVNGNRRLHRQHRYHSTEETV